jgi:hypothetical protein
MKNDKRSSLNSLKILGILILMLTLLVQCEEKKISNPLGNLPPDTDIFISYADTLNYTESIQNIYWDGRDPDGFVTGFYYTWLEDPQPSDWIFTEKRSMSFPLKITGVDTIYLFQVRAVDDQGLKDPSPAQQRFPIKNSPPVMKWPRNSRIPDTTFTVASFIWDVTDLDGDSTIDYFEYALDDDTLNWKRIAGIQRSITLNADSGLVQGQHSFTIRAIDIAGARSNVLRMPEDPADFWYVKQPKGHYLLIDDFADESSVTGYADRYYKTMMQNIVVAKGEDYSYWNIKKLFPELNTQFTQTLLLFDYVIWYADIMDEANEHFIAAQISLPKFLNRQPQGGKLIYSTMFKITFGNLGNPLVFTPVDSLINADYRCFPGNTYVSDSLFQQTFPVARTLPVLKVSETIVGIKPLHPKATAIPVYRFANPSNPTDRPLFVLLGKNDNSGEYDFIFSATPLHQLKANNNLDDFFDIILYDIFK